MYVELQVINFTMLNSDTYLKQFNFVRKPGMRHNLPAYSLLIFLKN